MALYGKDWKKTARTIKDKADWRCSKCNRQCIRPGEDTKHLTLSQRRSLTLQVHHLNRKPWDDNEKNLISVCSPCHLSYHYLGPGNVSQGQLELDFGNSLS